IRERVENLTAADRPVGWTQHVTMGPPFLEPGVTAFRLSADRSLVYPGTFGPADYLEAGTEFRWPNSPRKGGGTADMRVFTEAPSSSAYTTHRMNVDRDQAFFVAFSPVARLAFGYAWRRQDFPWLGIWEGKHARPKHPRNGTGP